METGHPINDFTNAATMILTNMAYQRYRTRWWHFLTRRRWLINDEPLRYDAAWLLRKYNRIGTPPPYAKYPDPR